MHRFQSDCQNIHLYLWGTFDTFGWLTSACHTLSDERKRVETTLHSLLSSYPNYLTLYDSNQLSSSSSLIGVGSVAIRKMVLLLSCVLVCGCIICLLVFLFICLFDKCLLILLPSGSVWVRRGGGSSIYKCTSLNKHRHVPAGLHMTITVSQ